MVDLSDPASVTHQLDQALRWFDHAGPRTIGSRHASKRSSAIEKRSLPNGIVDLINELSDELAKSGPFDLDLSAFEWIATRRAAERGVFCIQGDGSEVAFWAARDALVDLNRHFRSAARSAGERAGEQSRWRRLRSGFTLSSRADPRRVAEDLVPNERVLFACRASSYRLVIATGSRMLVADEEDGEVLWSSPYRSILTVATREFHGMFDWEADCTFLYVRTRYDEFEVTLSGSSTNADALVMIWESRRGTGASVN